MVGRILMFMGSVGPLRSFRAPYIVHIYSSNDYDPPAKVETTYYWVAVMEFTLS